MKGPAGRSPSERRLLTVLALTTMIGATGLAAGGSAGALLAAQLAGSAAAAGVPLALLVLGSAVASVAISRISGTAGRARGLAIGYCVGVLGALIVVVAAAASNLAGVYAGSTLLGAANAAVFLTRYAAAEVGGAGNRGRAVGLVFFGTAVGAVLSSSLLGPSAYLAHAAGLPRTTGLYLIAAATFSAAAAIFLRLSSNERQESATLAAASGQAKVKLRTILACLGTPASRAAVAVLAASNLIMVAVMTVAPVHLQSGGMTLQSIGMVISMHVAGMFAPAPVSGWLADRFGPPRLAVAGTVLLAAAGLIGGAAGDGSSDGIAALLILLGVAWNFGVMAGSTLLAESVTADLRPHAEGIGEAAMGIAAAVAAPIASLILAYGSFPVVWLVGAGIAVLTVLYLTGSVLRLRTR